MGRITIFSLANCPHCTRIKVEFDRLKIPYTEISLSSFPDRKGDMISLSNRATVPQIFFNDVHIGGADETFGAIKDWDLSKYVLEVESKPDPKDDRLLVPVGESGKIESSDNGVTATSFDDAKNSKDSSEATVVAAANTSTSILFKFHSGDWAGQISNFNSRNGSLIPVPDRFIPQEMIDWGEVPPQLEVLTSDNPSTNPNSSSNPNEWEESVKLERTTIIVLPEVGCAIDNLSTKKTRETVLLRLVKPNARFDWSLLQQSSTDSSSNNGVGCIFDDGKFVFIHENKDSHLNPSNTYRIVCQFPRQKGGSRTRVSFDLELVTGDENKADIVSPFGVTKERPSSKNLDRGNITEGGIDARTVTELVGKDAMNKPFATRSDESTLSSLIWPSESEGINDDKTRLILLPGGVAAKYGSYDTAVWSAEIGIWDESCSQRSIIRISFQSTTATTSPALQCTLSQA